MKMRKVDMSAKAVTARLRQLSELRRFGVVLSRAKIIPAKHKPSPSPVKHSKQPK